MRGDRRRRGGLIGLITAVALLAVVPAAGATTTFTWTYGGGGSEWSNAENWEGDRIPSGGPVDLAFTAQECGLSLFGCYTKDDIPNLDVDVLTLSNNLVESSGPRTPSTPQATSYSISGSAPIDLAGGVNIDTTVRGEGEVASELPISIETPIALTAPNSWSLATGVGLNGGVSGEYPLNVTMAHGTFELVKPIEVGPVTITGEGPGSLFDIGGEGDVNGVDHKSVSLHDLWFTGVGKVGPLAMYGGELSLGFLGRERGSPELSVEGALTLGGGVNFYPYLETGFVVSVAGAADLDSATLQLAGPCVAAGTVFTLIEARGGVSGTFNDLDGAPITNGEVVKPTGDCPSTGSEAVLQINYSAHAVTATVLSSAGPKSLETGSGQQLMAPVVKHSSTATAVTAAEIASLLRREITPTGRAEKIATLLRSKHVALSVSAPEAGSAVIDWYQVAPGARGARVLVASGRLSFKAAGTASLLVKLTSRGRRMLEHSRSVRLGAVGTFTPAGSTATSATRSFVLGR